MSGIGPVLQDCLQDGRVLQKRITHLEAPHVEIEAPAHCLIHAGDTISDLWREAGSVDKRIGGFLKGPLYRPGNTGKTAEESPHKIVYFAGLGGPRETPPLRPLRNPPSD